MFLKNCLVKKGVLFLEGGRVKKKFVTHLSGTLITDLSKPFDCI